MATQKKEAKKKSIRVRDLKPTKDAKGGSGRGLNTGRNLDGGGRNLDGGGRNLDGGGRNLDGGGGHLN